MSAAEKVWDDSRLIGRKVIFTYHHGEEKEGVVTSFNATCVFVRFGTESGSKACDPSMLRLAVETGGEA